MFYKIANSLNYKDNEINIPFTIINDKVVIGFNDSKKEEIDNIINEELSNNKSYNYVKKYNSEKYDIDKFRDILLKNGYKTDEKNIYYLKSENTNNYTKINLDEKIYTEYSSYNGISITTNYYYKDDKVKLQYNYSTYSSTIELDLNTNKWNCDSSLVNWCNDNAEDYVDNEMYNVTIEFNDLLSKYNINLDNIK